MSFVSKGVSSIFSAVGSILGLAPTKPPPPTPAPIAPTAENSSAAMDAAAQKAAAATAGGATSTVLTGGTGETDDQKLTSKVLLGQ